MPQSFTSQIPSYILNIIKVLRDNGYQGYLVGGAPRDLLLGRLPKDWDIATDADPEVVEGLFEDTLPTGKKYGTITVRLAGEEAEVTTFRGEGPYTDGRRPDWVNFSDSLEEDLARRDFTVNAMAYQPQEGRFVDPFGGRRDLRLKLLRAIGDPLERFREDGLRMLRFYRFQSTLGFHGARRTAQAIRPTWIASVSSERIREEFSRLVTGEAPGKALVGLYRSGLLRAFLPEAAAMAGVKQGLLHRYDVFGHAVAATEAIHPELPLRLAAFLHDVGKPPLRTEDERGIHFYGHDESGAEMAEAILKRLTYSNEIIHTVTTLIRHHMFNLGPEVTDGGLRRLVNRVGATYIPALIELRRADIIATNPRYDLAWKAFSNGKDRLEALLAGESVFSLKDLAVGGDDLQREFGWTPGPRIGEALNLAMQWVLEDPGRNTRGAILEYIRKQVDL
jgi:putative nucleotidyltransferase with HDIG domain